MASHLKLQWCSSLLGHLMLTTLQPARRMHWRRVTKSLAMLALRELRPSSPWHTGTSWSTVFACLQAALAAAATGQVALAAAITAMPVLGVAWLLHCIAAAEGHCSPLQSMQPIVVAYKRQLQPWRHVAARLRNSIRRQLAAL